MVTGFVSSDSEDYFSRKKGKKEGKVCEDYLLKQLHARATISGRKELHDNGNNALLILLILQAFSQLKSDMKKEKKTCMKQRMKKRRKKIKKKWNLMEKSGICWEKSGF